MTTRIELMSASNGDLRRVNPQMKTVQMKVTGKYEYDVNGSVAFHKILLIQFISPTIGLRIINGP